jgi:hypothetical protein
MKKIELKPIKHDFKIGETCKFIEPNVNEDAIFYSDGIAIGFYVSKIDGRFKELIEIANKELLSDRVPKTMMDRKRPVGEDKNGNRIYNVVSQYSTIIGSCPPKPHMRRPYASISSVHGVASAKTFIKAMLMACGEAEKMIKEIIPDQYARQEKEMSSVPNQWKFGKLFTSSISNFNIPAPYHQDHANIKNTVNVIITKRKNSKGGSLNVPDYDATIEQADNSILVYPAWRNMHGVTPIIPLQEGGYRNSLVFYPLKAFQEQSS